MKSFIKYLCLCIVFLLPLATHAKFTGEVIFLNSRNDYNELWITHIENAKNARLLYQHEWEIHNYNVQKDSPLIVISAGPPTSVSDVFLINRNQLGAGARNLTKHKFGATVAVDISSKGDVLFSNASILFHEVPPIEGLYLIPNEELKKLNPRPTLLKQGYIGYVQWSPDGRQFIYRTGNGIFLYNLLTGKDSLITKDKLYPAFSPDGKKLAFIHQPILEPGVEIDVISLEPLQPRLFPNDPEDHLGFSGLKWPMEKYLVYSVYDRQIKKTLHFVIHLDGGPPEQILAGIEDRLGNGLPSYVFGNTTFAVEPTNQLTTVWGKLKTHTLK